jgi:glycosyltransferase involved in cell wall biosynthesis
VKPTFSIITCTWNSEPYLAQSIASVLAQDYPAVEYIFVDGGSDDGTLERIRAIGRPVRLLQDVRGGIGRAMNAGLAAATGDIVAHLHADDYYADAQVLQRVALALERSGAPWAFGRCLSDIDGRRVPEGYAVPRFSRRRLLKGNFIPHPATFVRRELMQRLGGFDESIRYAMDYDLWLRLARVADPVQIDEPLAVFRRHAGSFSTANPRASLEDDYRVRRRHAGRWPWSVAYHWAHYAVRRRRLEARLAAAAGAAT